MGEAETGPAATEEEGPVRRPPRTVADDDEGVVAGGRPGEATSLAEILERFLRLSSESGDVDLEAFCARYPEALRARIRTRCEDALEVQQVLRSVGKEPAPTARLDPPDPDGAEPALADRRRVGDFRLIRRLGGGGMAEVYLAFEESSQREVALKLFALDPNVSPRDVERFRREASAGARLDYPGIVRVHSIGESDGFLYISMEYVQGRSLAEHLRDAREAQPDAGDDGTEWALGEHTHKSYCARMAELVARMADALQHAHDQGVIHRDVKPGNVMIDRAGAPHIVDFGVARDLTEKSISRTGDLAGTLAYMSPEQATAKRAPVDHRTDVFSLGVVLYELLTLERPFDGANWRSILHAIASRQPRPVRKLNPAVPRDLETICLTALEKRPDHRFREAGDMARDLRRFLDHESIHARPPSLPEKMRRALVRHRAAASVAALVGVALVATPLIAGRMARTAWYDENVEPFHALRSVEPLESLPREQLIELSALARRLLEDPRELSSPDRRLVEEQRARIEALASAAKDSAVARIERALDGGAASAVAAQFEGLASGIGELVAASMMTPENTQLRALTAASAWFPTLTVVSVPEGAQVILEELDEVHGLPLERTVVGETPLFDARVPPGYHRIHVVKAGFGSAELTRILEIRKSYVFEDHALWLRPTEEVVDGMVRIEPRPFVFGTGTLPDHPYREREVDDLPAFFIDAFEVSNGEYRDFVLATGHPPPPIWPEPYDEELNDLPVVAVSYYDARAYAEWAGKRLPTHMEWERASRGTEGATLPRDPLELPPQRYAVLQRRVAFSNLDDPRGFWADSLAFYRRAVDAVDSRPEGVGPEGLFHTLGNVRELTETIYARAASNGRVALQPGYRVTKGAGWDLAYEASDLVSNYDMPADVSDRGVGFRCAKSVVR